MTKKTYFIHHESHHGDWVDATSFASGYTVNANNVRDAAYEYARHYDEEEHAIARGTDVTVRVGLHQRGGPLLIDVVTISGWVEAFYAVKSSCGRYL